MAERAKKRGWRIFRFCFRSVRVFLLVVILFAVVLLAWVNTIGLPDFLKRPLLTELHARGLDLKFTRLRWRWNRGLVADNVLIGPTRQETNRPRFSIEQLAIEINHHELVRMRLHVDAVTLHGGKLVWPINDPSRTNAALAITNIQTRVRFLPGDQWTLDDFTGDFAGAEMRLSGTVTNANALRDWKVFHSHKPAKPGRLNERLRQFADVMDRIQFSEPPHLHVSVNGDARDPRSFSALINLDAKGAMTPWGTLTNGAFQARMLPSGGSNNLPTVLCELRTSEARFVLHPDTVRTITGDTRDFRMKLEAVGDEASTNVLHAQLDISATQFQTPWVRGTNAHFTARWAHAFTNAIPMEGVCELSLADARTRWGAAGRVQVNGTLTPSPAGQARLADASWAWWASLEPYWLDWHCRVQNVQAHDFKSSEVICGGRWRAPVLTVTNLHTEMYQGRFDADAILNVVTRNARFACVSDFDVLKAQPLLPPVASNWIAHQEFAWEKPPLVRGSGSVTLPAWTNAHPDLRELKSSLQISGDFKAGAASYRGIPMTSAQGHLYFSNETWTLPDIVCNRPEGTVELAHVSDERTHKYYFRFRSTVDVRAARHLLTPPAQRGLDYVQFSHPPVINGEVWGEWHHHDRVGFKGQIVLTNFVVRGESVTHFQSFLNYTNLFLELKDARLERTNEYLSASSMLIDFQQRRAYLTNGFSSMEPMVLLRAIGPKVAHDMEPYHFLKPPVIKANGVIPLTSDTHVADLHFTVDGGPFEWWKFHLPHISGNVDWVGELLTLSQIQGTFYEGKITGTAGFDFTRVFGTDYHFDTIITGSNLRALMMDLVPGTNRLEGTLNGHLSITQANTEDPRSWFGKGAVDLHDGLIWDIPIFGILTPVLDAISPGLGKTRASAATGTFVITNSVIRSDDLEIRSPTIRLFYRGTIDSNHNVNAVVDAEVGRDTPLFGTLFGAISTPFGKLFETRVTGNLSHPKREAVVPFVRWLNPFHWLQTLKDILPGSESGNSNGTAPPKK